MVFWTKTNNWKINPKECLTKRFAQMHTSFIFIAYVEAIKIYCYHGLWKKAWKYFMFIQLNGLSLFICWCLDVFIIFPQANSSSFYALCEFIQNKLSFQIDCAVMFYYEKNQINFHFNGTGLMKSDKSLTQDLVLLL